MMQNQTPNIKYKLLKKNVLKNSNSQKEKRTKEKKWNSLSTESRKRKKIE